MWGPLNPVRQQCPTTTALSLKFHLSRKSRQLYKTTFSGISWLYSAKLGKQRSHLTVRDVSWRLAVVAMKCFANCQKTSQMSTVNQKRRWRPTPKRRRESAEGKGSGIASNPWRQFRKYKKLFIIFFLSVTSQSKFTVCLGANRGVADRTSAGQAAGRSLITLFSQPKKEK